MTGKVYYITTLDAWQRQAARFANSHFIVLGADSECGVRELACPEQRRRAPAVSNEPVASAEHSGGKPPHSTNDPRILALVEADEGVHLDLEGDSDFEALPHPLAQKPISESAQAALAPHGVAPGASTFDAAEMLSRVHPLLKHRVF